MEGLRKLPIGIQDFESLRQDRNHIQACLYGTVLFPVPPTTFRKVSACQHSEGLFRGQAGPVRRTCHRFGTYTLGFPNEEVEEGFLKYLMPCYIHPKDRQSPFLIDNFVRDVRQGNTEQFIARLRSLFADTPYEIVKDLENHYQNVIWLLFKLMGYYTQAEYHTSEGRIDLVVKTPKFCYVMEFKLNGTEEEALAQISSKEYALPFALDGQQTVRLGISFSKKTRNIDKVLVG